MGDVDSNGYGDGNHVYGPGPSPYSIEVDTTHSGRPLGLHWGAKGINELTGTTPAQQAALSANASDQDDFDAVAIDVTGGEDGWYATFGDDAGLTPAEELDCRQRMRRAWA